MIGVGVYSLQSCPTPDMNNTSIVYDNQEGLSMDTIDKEMHHIPLWLIVAGLLVILVPIIYLIYDVFCKPEDVKQSMFKIFQNA